MLAESPGFAKALSTLTLLGTESFYSTTLEWRKRVTDIIHMTSDEQLPALLMRVYDVLLQVLLDDGRKQPNYLELASTAVAVMCFVHRLFLHYREERLLLDEYRRWAFLRAVVRTFEFTLSNHFEGSAALSDASRGVIALMFLPDADLSRLSVGEAEFSAEDASFQRALHLAHSFMPSAKDLGAFLECLVCCIESLLSVRSVLGHPEVETTDFGVVFSVLFPLQSAMAQRYEHAERLFRSICSIASAIRGPPSATTSSGTAKGVANFFSAVFTPSQVNTIQRFVSSVGASGSPKRSPITCREAVECVTSFFVCATEEMAIEACARPLFDLLCLDDVEEELVRFVLHSCTENLLLLKPCQLQRVTQLLLTAVKRGIAISETVSSVAAVLKKESKAVVNVKIFVLEFLSFYSTAVSHASEVETLHSVFKWTLEEVTSISDWVEPQAVSYLAAVTQFVRSALASAPLVALLARLEWPHEVLLLLLRAHGDGVREVAVTFRNLFCSMVFNEGQFVDVLISELRAMGGQSPWPSQISILLCVFVYLLQDKRGAWAAIRSNDIYVCLYLLHYLDQSTCIEEDAHLIGTSLALLLSHLRWSEAGGIVAHYVDAVRTPWMVQLLVDLATGFYTTTKNLIAADAMRVETVKTMTPGSRLCCEVVGGFSIPLSCRFEHTFPFGVLLRWIVEPGNQSGDWQKNLMELLSGMLHRRCLPLVDDAFTSTVVKQKLYELLPYVADVSRRDVLALLSSSKEYLTLEDVSNAQAIWERLAYGRIGEGSQHEFHDYITWYGNGALHGVLQGVQKGCSLNDRFTTALWVYWESCVGTDTGSMIQLWELLWPGAEGSTKVSLAVDTMQRKVIFAVSPADEAQQVVTLPFIPPGQWMHVVVSFLCNRLFSSTVTAFYDGVRTLQTDITVPGSHTLLPYPGGSSFMARILSESTYDFTCTVGFSHEGSSEGCVQRFVSFQLFNAALSQLEVMSLFCVDPYSLTGLRAAKRCPLELPLLRPEALRYLVASAAHGELQELTSSRALNFAPFPAESLILSLHVQNAELVECSQLQSLHNKRWVVPDSAGRNGVTNFLLHGSHSEPVATGGNITKVLISHNVPCEWLRWLCVISCAYDEVKMPNTKNVLDSADAKMAVLQRIAATTLRIIAAYYWKTEEVSDGNVAIFINYVTLQVKQRPQVYLATTDGVDAVFGLGAVKESTGEHCVVYSTLPVEDVFFNWKVTSFLPEQCQQRILFHLTALLQKSNPFRAVNALRLQHSSFFDGFICGLVREYVWPPVLESAVAVIALYIECIAGDAVALREVLNLCASIVPVERDVLTVAKRLVSKIPLVAFECIVVVVLNHLLKVLCGACVGLHNEGLMFAEALSHAMPQCWFHILTSEWAHPVSVTMAMHLFTLCYKRSETFRRRFGDVIPLLYENLRHHAHQSDLLIVLISGFWGSDWDQQKPPYALLNQLYTTSEGTVPSFLQLAMHLLGRSASLLLRPDAAVNYPHITCASFYAAMGAAATAEHCRARSQLRCYISVVVFCAWLRRGQKIPDDGANRISFTKRESADHGEMRRTVVAILQWVARRYPSDRRVSKAMYVSQKSYNPMDMALLCLFPALPMDKDVGSVGNMPLPLLDVVEGLETTVGHRDIFDGGYSGTGGFDFDDCDDEREELVCDARGPNTSPATEARDCDFDALLHQPESELYNACRALFVAHIKRYARSAKCQPFVTGRKSVRSPPKLVLALQRALALCPSGIGLRARYMFCVAVCCFCLEALTDMLREEQPGETGQCVLDNMVATGKYLADRLVSGAATPTLAVTKFLQHLLKLHLNTEQVKDLCESLSECLLLLMDSISCGRDARSAASVIDSLHDEHIGVFGYRIPSEELLRLTTHRLLDISEVLLASDVDRHSVNMEKLVGLWRTFLVANREVPFFRLVWNTEEKAARVFYMLTESTDGGVGDLVAWVMADHGNFKQSLCKDEWTQMTLRKTFLQKRDRRWAACAVEQRDRECADLMSSCKVKCNAMNEEWSKLTDTSTFVDTALLARRIECCDVLHRHLQVQLLPNYGMEEKPGTLHLHPSGAVGYPCGVPFDLLHNLTNAHIRYPSLRCRLAASTASDDGSVSSHSRASVPAALLRIVGSHFTNPVLFVGNVYYLRGDECSISVMSVTPREVVIVGDSQFSASGDFSIGVLNPRDAWGTLSLDNGSPSCDNRNFLPWLSERGNTEKLEIARHSCCFRTICVESRVPNSPSFTWRFSTGSILKVHQRFFQHRPVALEFQLENGDRCFIAALDERLCFSRAKQEEIMSAVSRVAPQADMETYSQKESRMSELGERWKQRRISNRMYLLQLNDIAGRTVADMGQYPVMPWVLSDYESSTIDLRDPGVYRDLAKPIGALNEAKERQLRDRYEQWFDKSQPPFHHGTHYSSSAVVMYYLIRLQPFTQRSVRYQGGRLDIAGRIFHSVSEAWNSCGGVGDVKELVPEFFCLPEMFMNKSRIDLGVRLDGVQLGDVVLPEWCGGDVERFVHLHAEALESDVVSGKLHEWVDLVFGNKQRGRGAVDAINVFLHLSYGQAVGRAIAEASSEEDCKAIVATAANFGQTPRQLFNRAHARRFDNRYGPTPQQAFINEAGKLSVRWRSVCYPWGNKRCCTPITSLRIVDSSAIASTRFSLILPTTPMQVCHYSNVTRELSCHEYGKPTLLCVLPNVWHQGYGELTTMCTSSLGGIICIGTTNGRVVICSRVTSTAPFTIMSILNACRNDDSAPVKLLKMWNSGHLSVVCEDGPRGSLWHVAHSGVMFCFKFDISDVVDESSTIRDITRDEQSNCYFIATHNHIVQLSSTGRVLGVASVSKASTATTARKGTTAPPANNDAAADGPKQHFCAAEYINFESYSKTNILLAGHEDGTISFWTVRPLLGFDQNTFATEIKMFHSFTVDGDTRITTITHDGAGFSAGTASGEVHTYSVPDPFADEE
ncbi:Concanavalin A-like lectin/glucanases superfamily/Beige/BEACH domain containing protein [Trypanosoma brucei equiperdum]|uniref:Concanavalin A-like lectin/glucanases superfamily/Beige/BEACH domain containing protein n=1 Tax=Trypanosoma brucei equiperdum TaxID=630700 RepID=A0A3L6L5U6_9TRYP|nr:Concanavalin A-like lectin/glucanases superfamily/Beige/BEACH domain containing protein [Trypanosoma brucei equiperdum]